MKLTVFGLSISSSWGNGHATLLRGLFRALVRRGHRITFFEHDTPYYAAHRDLTEIPGVHLSLYADWEATSRDAEREVRDSDVAMVTSYCPNGIAASELVLRSGAFRVFYDLDTPVTLDRLQRGEPISYIGARGLADFDLVLSYTGGPVLTHLQERLGAKRVVPLYGSVDPEVHRPVAALAAYQGDLCYLGTYAEDRQQALESLFIEPARRRRHQKFVIGGAIYPQLFPWAENIYFVRHLPPEEHAAFYCSSRLTLNVTRRAMAEMGYCPSGRLFEAAACGVPMVSDHWNGLSDFFEPGREILVAHGPADVLAAMDLSDAELGKISQAAKERVLAQHTADHRAIELELALGASAAREENRRSWDTGAEQSLGA
jgi:spore maturation protein CgeB